MQKLYQSNTIKFQITKWFILMWFFVWSIISIVFYIIISMQYTEIIQNSIKDQYINLSQEINESSDSSMIDEAINSIKEQWYIIFWSQNSKYDYIIKNIWFQKWKFIDTELENKHDIIVYMDTIWSKYIYIAKSTQDFQNTKSTFLIIIIIINILFALFIIYISNILSKKITKPIYELSDNLSSSEYSGKIINIYDSGHFYEIWLLSKAFDKSMLQIHNLSQKEKEFLQDASHELRTPITGILSSLELIEEDNLTSKQKDKISNISLLVYKLKKITDELIYISRWKYDQKIDNISVQNIISQNISLLSQNIQDKNIELFIDKDHDIIVCISEFDINKIISNLIDNAIKYNKPSGKIHISINNNILKISDTWIWIDKDLLWKIGQRFVRSTKAIWMNYDGIWLWLSIVYSIAKNYWLNIYIDSDIWVWTTFDIDFTNIVYKK